jgi:hypothetical protein
MVMKKQTRALGISVAEYVRGPGRAGRCAVEPID